MQKFLKANVLAFLALIIVGIQQYPNWYAYTHTPSGYFFSGQASWFDPWDINVYVTAIKFGQSKNILLKNHYTTQSTANTLMYPLYTVIGYIFPGNPYLLFHILASIVGIGICVSLFWLFQRELRSFWLIVSAVIVCSLGGGLGWIGMFTGQSAGSIITSFNFASSFQRAHEGIGTLLYIFALYCTYVFIENRKKTKYNTAALISLFLLIFFYPYYILSYFLICAAYLVFKSKKNKDYKQSMFLVMNCMIIGSFTLVYYLHLRSTDFLSAISEKLKPVSLVQLMLGYSSFIFYFIIDHFIPKKNFDNKLSSFLLIWIGISIVLSYVPFFGFARFYLRGLFFPFTLLMFLNIKNYKQDFFLPLLLPVLVIVFSLSRVSTFHQRIIATQQSNKWYYLPQNMEAAFDFLSLRKRDGILTYFVSGNFIPPYTNKSVYFGHILQTPDSLEREIQVKKFYRGQMDDETAYNFLKENNINFILYSTVDGTYAGHVYTFLEHRFENDSVKIYSLKASAQKINKRGHTLEITV